MQQVLFETTYSDLPEFDVYLSEEQSNNTFGSLFSIAHLTSETSVQLLEFFKQKQESRVVDMIHMIISLNPDFSKKLIALSELEEISSKKRSTLLNMVKTMQDNGCIYKAKAHCPPDADKRVRARSLIYFQPVPEGIIPSIPKSEKTSIVSISDDIITEQQVRKLLERTNTLKKSKSPLLIMYLAAAMPESTCNKSQMEAKVYTRQTINGNTNDFPIKIELVTTVGDKLASVTDLRVLIAAYKIIITRIIEDRAPSLEKFEIIIDDILDILNLPHKDENRYTVRESFNRLNNTQFRWGSMSQELAELDYFFNTDNSITLIHGLSTLHVEHKNKRKPVGVRFGIDADIMAQLGSEFKSKVLHDQFLEQNRPSGFEWKLYLWFRRSIGSVINTQSGTLVYNDNDLNKQISPGNDLANFRRKMKNYAKNHVVEEAPEWSRLYGCFFRIIPISKKLTKYEFKIEADDSLIQSSIQHKIQSSLNNT